MLITIEWFPTLERENVELVCGRVQRITEGGVVAEDGTERPADTIIWGTGFQCHDFVAPMRIEGLGGRELNEVWAERPEAYLGTTVSGFPNMFVMYGPNTNHGSGSVPYTLECQFNYAIDGIRKLRDRDLRWIDLKPEVQAAWRRGDGATARSSTQWVTGRRHQLVRERAGRQHQQLARALARVPPAHARAQPRRLPRRPARAGAERPGAPHKHPKFDPVYGRFPVMEPVSTPKEAAREGEGGSQSELDQDLGKKQHGKGKRGSLENPEVYENVPGHVIPILEREFDDFDTEAASFLRGEQSEEQFIGFRLKQGVYGQRQPDVQMVRVKLPFGGVTPEQMEMFGDVVERYAPLGKGHITTRQNIQIHHIPLAEMTEVIRKISESGSPRARAAATRCATSPATPGPASARASPSTSPPTPAPTCATSSATRPRS